MDVHITNETRHFLNQRPKNSRLVHLILSEECLGSCDVGLDGITSSVSVAYQTRKHGSGECSDWTPIDVKYVSGGAVASILLPTIDDHPGLFTAINKDGNGLFLSAVLECDDAGRVDPFDSICFRFSVKCARRDDDFQKYRELLFLYDELVIGGTRYDADGDRIPTLCAQMASYISKKRRTLGDWALTARSKINAILSKDGKSARRNKYRSVPIDVRKILATPSTLDPPRPKSGEQNPTRTADSATASLLKKASEFIGKTGPAGIGSRGPDRYLGLGGDKSRYLDGERAPGVVSGLKQSANAYTEEISKDGGGRDRGHAAVVGLEPAGSGRFVGGTKDAKAVVERARFPPDAAGVLEDVLIFDGSSRRAETLTDVFDDVFISLANGDCPANAWRRRPVSVVPRTHMFGGSKFYVVSYEASLALGGATPIPKDSQSAVSPSKVLAVACAEAGVSSPLNLSAAEKERMVQQFPNLRNVLFQETRGSSYFLSYFSVSSEHELSLRFSQTCTKAVASAVSAAVRKEPKLRQMLWYETTSEDESRLRILAARIPNIIAACVESLTSERGKRFYDGALATAVLSNIVGNLCGDVRKAIRLDPRERYKYTWYGTDNPAVSVEGRYRSFCACRSASENGGLCYLFDYYSASGECIKVSRRPVPVIIGAVSSDKTADVEERHARIAALEPFSRSAPCGPCPNFNGNDRRKCDSCSFPDWFSGLERESACERFLPGQSYAYVCIGYDSQLNTLIVFPGGFVVAFSVAEYFAISDENALLVINRMLSRCNW